ncbi:MAG: OsmC family protein, partial [uncultured Pseudonocardia sp.]
ARHGHPPRRRLSLRGAQGDPGPAQGALPLRPGLGRRHAARRRRAGRLGRRVPGAHGHRAGRGGAAPGHRRRREQAVLGRHAAGGPGGLRRGDAARGGDGAGARGVGHGAGRGRPGLPRHARRGEGRTGRVLRHPAAVRPRHHRRRRPGRHAAEAHRAVLRGPADAHVLAHHLGHRRPV